MADKSVISNLKHKMWRKIKKINNRLVDLRAGKRHVKSDLTELIEVRERAEKRTDINDYLDTIFLESLSINPKLIVELGVRGGESLFLLERVSRLCGSKIVSVDIDDCSHVSSNKKWSFIQKSDIDFAGEFKSWCKKKRITPKIDLLFIDTSHLYDHTVDEIRSWFPHLSKRAKVLFHDTNMGERFIRKDGSMGFSWDNERGVIRAIEEFFNANFNEKEDFSTVVNGWVIKHYAHCNGLTIMERLPFLAHK